MGKNSIAVASLAVLLLLAGCGDEQDACVPSGTPGAVRNLVYVSNGSGNSITAYTIDATSGALTQLSGSPFAVNNPTDITIDPTSRFIVVALGNSTLQVFGRDMAPVGSPEQFTGFPLSLAMHPTGSFVYVGSVFSGGVNGFTLSSTGILGLVQGSPFAPPGTASDAMQLAIHPSGTRLYGLSDSLVQYVVNATNGTLSNPTATALVANRLVVHPSGNFAYLLENAANRITGFAITSGDITATQVPGSPVAVNSPESLVFSNNGNFAFVIQSSLLGGAGSIASFSVASTGELTPVTVNDQPVTVATGAQPRAGIVDFTGNFLYVVNQGSDNISAYRINATTGVLTEITGSPFLSGDGPVRLITTRLTPASGGGGGGSAADGCGGTFQ